MTVRFKRGDQVKVTADDLSVPCIGTVMQTRSFTGAAQFEVKLATGEIHVFNLNSVEVEVLFSADVAREPQPLPKIDEDVAVATIVGMMWHIVDQNTTIGMVRDAAAAAYQETVRLIESKRVSGE